MLFPINGTLLRTYILDYDDKNKLEYSLIFFIVPCFVKRPLTYERLKATRESNKASQGIY